MTKKAAGFLIQFKNKNKKKESVKECDVLPDRVFLSGMEKKNIKDREGI